MHNWVLWSLGMDACACLQVQICHVLEEELHASDLRVSDLTRERQDMANLVKEANEEHDQ